MASLKDIATACGVSTATVSKALNDQSDVGEETRKRIKAKAKELGYLPNAAARMLKTNHSKNIGVLYTDDAGMGLTHEYFSGVLNGIKIQAEQLGYDVTFINTNAGNHRTHLEHATYRNLDGVVVVCAEFAEPTVIELMNSELPVATIDYVHPNCVSVSSNNVQGIRELVEYIIEQGHKKIAYICGQGYSYVTKERLATYYATLEEHGIEIRDDYVKEAHYLETGLASKYTTELLNLSDPPTCIMYSDDTALIGGVNVINERGLRIPDDISIAGYDGTHVSQLLRPAITTIKQNTKQIGMEAAKHLIANIERPRIALKERIVVDGELLAGQSVSIPAR